MTRRDNTPDDDDDFIGRLRLPDSPRHWIVGVLAFVLTMCGLLLATCNYY